MSRLYIRLLFVASFLIAITGATFSIIGLAKLFSGAAISVAIMAAALEFAKLVSTGFLYRYWGHVNQVLRTYLIFAITTLVVITSVGIFGYLSSAYQASSINMKSQMIKMATLAHDNERVLGQIAEFRRFIDEIPTSRISRKFEFQKEYEPKIQELRGQSDLLVAEISALKIEMLKTQAKIGPAIYLAEALGLEIDIVVRYLILIFVCVFDPLAICLVFCLNLAIRLREKYRGNEARISAHALSSPVDHRFKKAA
jgi:hypothetical protein